MASLELQIARLRDMKSILDEFSTMLKVRIEAVEGMLDELERISLPREIAEKYRYNYLSDDKDIVKSMANEIRTDHFGYIDKKIQQFIEIGGVN